MQELEFSIMAANADGIQPLLDEFEAQHRIHVRLRLLAWDTGWSDLLKVALYGDGPDISEIGSTWLGDLVAMNAIHPFHEKEIGAVGKPGAFLPTAWQGGRTVGGSFNWAIPWLAGARLLFFRRPLLERAGIDERTAFQTAEQFDDTLNRLQAAGVRVPWTAPTGLTHTTLLNVASWVWGAGGDFISADGKQTLFSQPPARAGLRAYFALGRFLPPDIRHLNGLQPDSQFLNDDQTAITLSGPWLFNQAAPELKAQMGVALPPGASFVGGSHLVIWKHTLKHSAALRLIHFLTQPQAQVRYAHWVGLLPVRLDALAEPPYASDPLWQMAIAGLKSGRTFPVTRAWGLMEDRLTTALSTLWADTFANPDADLDALVAKRLEPLAQRLDLVLGQA
jgi:multiple sugar transport system substrate-binding protein